MNIKYIGPFRPGVEIAATGQVAEYDIPLEVEDDDLAEALLRQSIWVEVKKQARPKRGTAPDPATDDQPEEGTDE